MKLPIPPFSVYMSFPDIAGLPSSKKWSAQQDYSTSMTYMHERVEYVVLRQQLTFSCVSKTSPVDNQENDHTATGSNDVHLTRDKNKSFQTKIIQQVNYISMQYNRHDPLISTPQQADPRQANSLANVS